MKRLPLSPPQRPLTLVEEKDEFTNEGAPPPGVVGADLPHRARAVPSNLPPRKAEHKRRRRARP